MSVDHFLLPVTTQDLSFLIKTPSKAAEFVEKRGRFVRRLEKQGLAIVSITAGSASDPLAFIEDGMRNGPDRNRGRIGTDDIGFDPPALYRNRFLVQVARKLKEITPREFKKMCDLDWLEENQVYPGSWLDPGRGEALVEFFRGYRQCVLSAKSGKHLLVWTG